MNTHCTTTLASRPPSSAPIGGGGADRHSINTSKMGGGRCVLAVPKTLEQPPISAPNPSRNITTVILPNYKSPARRNAIAEIKSSDDLALALSRVEGILQVQDCNIVLRYFGESRRWKEASELFDWMQRNDRLNFASYSSFFKYMGASRNHLKALEIYDSIHDKSLKVNVSVCNSILGCMITNGRFESSMKLFDQMKDDGLIPDLVTYSTLLAGFNKVKNGYSRAMKLVKEIENKGFRMDCVIYGTLIAICASNNLCEEAEVYFQKMKNNGYSPNLFHYSSLLNAYSVDGNYMKAENLVNEMKSAGLVPNKVILTTLLKVYARSHMFEKSHKLLSELEALGYAKDEMPYCLLMDNLAKAGHLDEAKRLFSEMKDKGVKSDGYSYSIMISALCRKSLLKEAKQLAKDFEADYGRYDLVMINTLLRAYCNTGDIDSVMQMLRKMDDLAISPDWNTFHILIKFFCRENLYQLAYRTVEDMHRKGHQLSEDLCSSVILQLGQSGFASEAFSVYNMLRFSKRILARSLHEKMLDILVSAGLLKDAYVLVKDNMELLSADSLEKFAISFMEEGNINLINDVLKAFHRSESQIGPDVIRAAVLRYIATPEKKLLLLQLLEWMGGQGYCVDSYSRNLLLRNSHIFGQKHLIAEILSKQQMTVRKMRSGKV